MANTERTIASMRSLKKQGVQISIDDFPVFASGDRSADGHDGKGKAPVARPGGAGIDQDDHDG